MFVVRPSTLRSALTMHIRAVRAVAQPTRVLLSTTTDKFRFQQHVWENYINTGEGCNQLFASFLAKEAGKNKTNMYYDASKDKEEYLESSTISADHLREFLQSQPKEVGIGEAELAELEHMKHKELNLKDFRAYIRHATHDWNVHV
jgi:hypothetical protein